MPRAPAQPPRSTSTSSRRLARAVIAAALLIGALLASGLPAPASRAAGTAGTAGSPGSPSSTGPTGPTGHWGAPFTVLAPVTSDLLPPSVAVSAANGVATASGRTDEDAPASAQAEILTAGSGDAFGTQLMPAATQATLAAAFLGRRLVLMTGTSSGAAVCCMTASVQVADAGGLHEPELLAGGLEGASTGALVPVRGGLLAAVDNQAGITVARSDAAGALSGTKQLVAANPTPPLMAAGPLRDGGAMVAWTAPASPVRAVVGTTTSPAQSPTAGGYNQPRNRLIDEATAGPSGAPGRVKLAVAVPAGRQIDALSVIPHGSGATLSWTESWFVGDRYLSRVFSSDVSRAGAGAVQILSSATSAVVGLSGAGTPDGGELLSWQACDIGAGTCEAQAALRSPEGDWGPVRSLGRVDPTSFPLATQSHTGWSLVGWISGGRVYGASAAPGGTGFAPAVQISRAADASNLALSFGAGTRAAAVWVQGTDTQGLVGARFTP